MTNSELAARIEGLDGLLATQKALPFFREAFHMAYPTPTVRVARQANGEPWGGDGIGPFTEEYKKWSTEHNRFETYLQCGAHLDAAMTLVPDGCLFTARTVFAGEDHSKLAGLASVVLFEDGMWKNEWQYTAATPALALCAAALRAHDQGEG